MKKFTLTLMLILIICCIFAQVKIYTSNPFVNEEKPSLKQENYLALRHHCDVSHDVVRKIRDVFLDASFMHDDIGKKLYLWVLTDDRYNSNATIRMNSKEIIFNCADGYMPDLSKVLKEIRVNNRCFVLIETRGGEEILKQLMEEGLIIIPEP